MFYLTLPSNSSMALFPDNTLSDYTTQPPRDFALVGSWEVAVSEIMYLSTWKNIADGREYYVKVGIPNEADLKIHLKMGYYKYPEGILSQLARSLDRKLKKRPLRTPCLTASILEQLRSALEPVVIRFSEKLRQLLGFETGYFNKPGVFGSRLPVDIHQSLYAIYIYCDLLEHRVVGDTLAPFLSIIPMEGQHSDTVYRRYEKLHYFPV